MNAFLLGRKILLVQNDGNSKSFQMKLNTKITEMLGIDLPIIGAPIVF